MYLIWKTETNFLIYKMLTAQVPLTLGDGADCQLLEIPSSIIIMET